jgi:hypothetical protein
MGNRRGTGRLKTIKKKNMPESTDNFIVHSLSGIFTGIGTFHNRGRKTFLRKIRVNPSVAG